MWAILLIVLLAVLVPPFVNVNRYRKRVADAISRPWAAMSRSPASS